MYAPGVVGSRKEFCSMAIPSLDRASHKQIQDQFILETGPVKVFSFCAAGDSFYAAGTPCS